ncbi:hypothetical protein ABIB05_004037, partial [Bradyrhizobium sp. LB5.2]
NSKTARRIATPRRGTLNNKLEITSNSTAPFQKRPAEI